MEGDIGGAEELQVPTFPDPDGIVRDDPKFYNELDDVVQQADLSYTVLERLVLATTALADATERSRQAMRAVSAALRGASKHFRVLGAQDPTPLLTMADMLADVDPCFSTCLAQLETQCNHGLADTAARFRATFDCKAQLNQAHLKFTATMAKFCATGFGEDGEVSEEFHRRSHKAYATRKNAHLTAADCLSMLQDVMSVEKINVMQLALQSIMAQVTFFQQGSDRLSQHDSPLQSMFDALQNMRLKAEANLATENEHAESVRKVVLRRHEQEVALIPAVAEKRSNFAASLKRVVTRSANTSGRRKPKATGSGKWRTKSKKERDRMQGFGPGTPVDDDPEAVEEVMPTQVSPTSKSARACLPSPSEVDVIQDKQGYLFRRQKDKRWKLDSLAIINNCLCRIGDDGSPQELAQLLLSTVREQFNHERHHVFEVVTPSETLVLQALGPQEYAEWVAALHAGIAAALDQGNADKKDANVQINPVEFLASIEGNTACADCNDNEVEWASINLGVVLCIKCSGVHRSLGVHISKVRSILLDRWPLAVLVIMKTLGNARVNAHYEGLLPSSNMEKPTRATSDADREAFIRAKYIEKAFLDPDTPLPSAARGSHSSLGSRSELLAPVVATDSSLPSPLMPLGARSRASSFSSVVSAATSVSTVAASEGIVRGNPPRRRLSRSGKDAPKPPSPAVSPRRFFDHPPPSFDVSTAQAAAAPTSPNKRTSVNWVNQLAAAVNDARKPEAGTRAAPPLPGAGRHTLAGASAVDRLALVPEGSELETGLPRKGSDGVFDNLEAEDGDEDILMHATQPRKTRRSSHLSSAIATSNMDGFELDPSLTQAMYDHSSDGSRDPSVIGSRRVSLNVSGLSAAAQVEMGADGRDNTSVRSVSPAEGQRPGRPRDSDIVEVAYEDESAAVYRDGGVASDGAATGFRRMLGRNRSTDAAEPGMASDLAFEAVAEPTFEEPSEDLEADGPSGRLTRSGLSGLHRSSATRRKLRGKMARTGALASEEVDSQASSGRGGGSPFPIPVAGDERPVASSVGPLEDRVLRLTSKQRSESLSSSTSSIFDELPLVSEHVMFSTQKELEASPLKRVTSYDGGPIGVALKQPSVEGPAAAAPVSHLLLSPSGGIGHGPQRTEAVRTPRMLRRVFDLTEDMEEMLGYASDADSLPPMSPARLSASLRPSALTTTDLDSVDASRRCSALSAASSNQAGEEAWQALQALAAPTEVPGSNGSKGQLNLPSKTSVRSKGTRSKTDILQVLSRVKGSTSAL